VETVSDFEDLLAALEHHGVRYLIIGGLAFIYHAKPRYTKDLDLWIDPEPANVERANAALAEFGSPHLMSVEEQGEILQLGMPPNRIDLLRETGGIAFDDAWAEREEAPYGAVPTHWVGLETLIAIKRQIDHPRHQEDVRVLEAVKRRREHESE
jgi:predicted nucleotidyltransferase